MPQEMPGAQFEDLTGAGLPNITSAGTSPELQSPSPTWPFAGIIPELNTRWLNPGLFLDTGTEFGQDVGSAQKASMALPNFSFPGFPSLFDFPGFTGTQGAGSPPTQQAGAGKPSIMNLLSQGGSTLSKLLRGLQDNKTPSIQTSDMIDADAALGRLRDYRAFAPDSLQSEIDQYFGTGKQPFDLTGNAAASTPTPYNLGVDPNIHMDEVLTSLIESNKPLSFTGAFAPGSGNLNFDPSLFNLTGEGLPTGLPNYNLTSGAGTGAAGSLPGALGGATPWGLGLGSVLMAVGSQVGGDAGKDLQLAGASLMGATGAASLGATAAAGGATVAAEGTELGLSGVAGAAAPVFAIPAAIAAIYGAFGPWGHGVNFPTGYVQFIGPDGQSWAVDPKTGAVLQGIDSTRGRGTFKLSPDTMAGHPATAQQFIDWGIPSNLYPQTRPSDVYSRITGGTLDPNNIPQPPGGGTEDHYSGPSWQTPVFADPSVNPKEVNYYDQALYDQWLASQPPAPDLPEAKGD